MPIQYQSTGFETYLDVVKKKMLKFHYHLKCQVITDNRGDIEVYLMISSQNTVFIDNYMKLCQFNNNKRDL